MRIWAYGDDVNTDMLFPGKYTAYGHIGDAHVHVNILRAALDEGRPVVALETTIVAHGFPQPDGVDVGLGPLGAAAGGVPAVTAMVRGALAGLGRVPGRAPARGRRRKSDIFFSRFCGGRLCPRGKGRARRRDPRRQARWQQDRGALRARALLEMQLRRTDQGRDQPGRQQGDVEQRLATALATLRNEDQ